jgi:hypothetical protein
MAERVTVRFHGEGAGSGELSWGQRELWEAFRRQNTWMPLHGLRPLPAGTSVEAVADRLRFLMSRYHTMRTLIQTGPHGPRQVVAGSGEVELEIYDTDPGGDPAELADRLRYRFKRTDHDFATEWPVRLAVIRHHGTLTHQLMIACHLVVDAIGARLLIADLVSYAAGGSPAAPPMPPLEQTRWQRSEAGQRHSQRVIEHWEGQLRKVPARRFAAPRIVTAPRYWQAAFRSPALHLAVRAITARAGLDAAPVLLACYVIALARVTGTEPVVARVLVSNRFRPGLARTVSPITQLGLLVVEVAGRSFEEVLDQIRHRVMATYKNAYYDPIQLAERVAQLGRECGEEIDLGCEFNDRRLGQQPGGPLPAPAQARAALADSSFVWEHKQDDKPYEPLFIHVESAPDTMALTANGDTHYISPADMEACLREIEAVAVAAAEDPAVRSTP